METSHFLTLLHADPSALTRDDLSLIFSFFLESDELIMRTSSVLSVLDSSRQKTFVGQEKLIELALSDLSRKREVCELVGDNELCTIIDKAEVRFAQESSNIAEINQTDCPGVWLSELVGDHARDSIDYTSSAVVAIFEAYYGLLCDYDMAWYLGQPLITSNNDFSTYFQLWKCGGDYALTEHEVVVSYRI